MVHALKPTGIKKEIAYTHFKVYNWRGKIIIILRIRLNFH